MTKYEEKIFDITTGETTYRDFSPQEIEETKKEEIKAFERLQAVKEKEKAKLNLLDKLGITEDEAKLLLG